MAFWMQFRLAEQRPGTPLYEKLSREFEARCRAAEKDSRRKYEEASAAKRAFVIPKVMQHQFLWCAESSSLCCTFVTVVW